MPHRVRLGLSVVLIALTVPWVWESFTCGRCFYSRNVAPFVVLAILAFNLSLVYFVGREHIWKKGKR